MTQDEFNVMFLAAMNAYGNALNDEGTIPTYSAQDITNAEAQGAVVTMPGVVLETDESGETTATGYFQAPLSVFRAPAVAAAADAQEAVAALETEVNDVLANAKLDYIGSDLYIYKWDSSAQQYENSGISIAPNLTNYYTKSQVDALIAAIHQMEIVAVNTLPTASASTMQKLYLIPHSGSETNNYKDEYITIATTSGGTTTYAWELIGSTRVDISGKLDTVSQDDFNEIFD